MASLKATGLMLIVIIAERGSHFDAATGAVFSKNSVKKRFRTETKEIGMSKHITLLGTACVLGMALVAAPASASTLTGFAGDVTTSYGKVNPKDADTVQSWLLGGNIAGPLSDLPNDFKTDGFACSFKKSNRFSVV